jgi:voltage-gated potassium channel
MFLGITLAGTLGYFWLEDWPLLDALYMTIISMTTVGYGEIRELTAPGRIFTMALLVVSIGTAGYAVSTIASFVVEGEFHRILRGRRMDKRISNLRNHIILCGAGRTGRHIAEEFQKTNTPFVVIEQNVEAIPHMLHLGDVLHLQADATQDESLLLAGIEHARGLVTVLGEDKDNVFVVLTARSLNPELRIVARLIEEENAEKLRKAGADEVVSPNAIGGLRMASVVIRPAVVSFLDEMLRVTENTLRVEEVEITDTSPVAGQTLRDADIRGRTGLLVVALKSRAGHYQFNPDPQTRLISGDILIVIGTPDQLATVR